MDSKVSRFDYVKYDEDADQQSVFKDCFMALAAVLENTLKPGRAKSLAITKLEETYMWVGKAVRDDQIARNGSAPMQEERKNG